MASTLDINAIRDYLLQVGCKIEYPILVNAFKKYLYNPDPNVQGKIRTQFKDYVNRLATVSLENNMKFIILRPEFRPPQVDESPPKQVENLMPPKQTIVDSQPVLQIPSSLQPKDQNPVANIPMAPRATQIQQPPPVPRHQQQQSNQRLLQVHQQQQSVVIPNGNSRNQHDSTDGPPIQMITTPNLPAATKRNQMIMQRPESLNLTSTSMQMPPPHPPPRRRQSNASLFKESPKPVEKSRELHDLAKKSPGRVKEHALKLNSFSSRDLSGQTPTRSNTMKENRLSRDSTISGSLVSALQRNGSHLTTRSRSSHREDESDSSSLQHIDPLRRKWAIEACNCNYNGLLTLLREDPKLAHYKDIVNGYTALHWAAKFGNLDIIKLIAGTHGVSSNTKSSAGYTPLHVAYMFNRSEAADLLLKIYKANPNVRDHSGKRPMQYSRTQTSSSLTVVNK